MNGQRHKHPIITYILETAEGELYCGKTSDLQRRMNEHAEARKGSWFEYKNRKAFDIIFKTNIDVEKEIKRFGIRKFMDTITKGCLRP